MANNGKDPTFFYSNILNACSARGFTLVTPNITRNGDVCAYIDAAPITNLWACPVTLQQCWTANKTCGGGSSITPSTAQIVCNGGSGNLWCCNSDFEECATDGTLNQCYAKTFKNPVFGIDAALADKIATSAVSAGLTGALTTVATALAAITTTRSSVSAIPTTAPASESSLASTVSGTPRTTSSSPASTSTSSNNSSKSSSISGGAIAGIVIGIVAVVAIIGIALFFWRRRKARGGQARGGQTDNVQELHNTSAFTSEKKESAPKPSAPKPTSIHELDSNPNTLGKPKQTSQGWDADSTPVSTWDPNTQRS